MVQPDAWQRLASASTLVLRDDVRASRALERCWHDFDRAGDVAGRLCTAAALCQWMHVQRRDFRAYELWRSRLEAAVALGWPALDPAYELRGLIGAAWAAQIRPIAGLPIGFLMHRIATLIEAAADPATGLSATDCLHGAAAAARLAGHADDMAGLEAAIAQAEPFLREADEHARLDWLQSAGAALTFVLPEPRGPHMLAHARELAARAGLRAALFDTCHDEIFIRLGRDGPEGLEPLFEQLEQALDATRLYDVARRHHLLARSALHRPVHGGNAYYYARSAIELLEQSGYPISDAAMLYATFAYACARQGELPAALAAIEKVALHSSGAQHEQQQSLALFLRAYAALRNQTLEQARPLLQRAFAEADRLQWFGFRPVPEIAGQLVEAALRLQIDAAPYARKLVELRKLSPPGYAAAWPWKLRIATLGRFGLANAAGPLAAHGKLPRKTLELLHYLAGSPGLTAAADRLTASLWPELEGDMARGAFRTALHRLRRLLEHADAVQFDGASVRIDPAHVYVDTLGFERLVDSSEASLRSNDGERACFEGSEALALYQGHFLLDQQEAPWMLAPRQRLRSRFTRLVTMLGEHYERAAAAREAQSLYRRAIELDPLNEEIARHLMTVLRDAGDAAAAFEVYRALRQLLSVELGQAPAPQTQRLADSLRP